MTADVRNSTLLQRVTGWFGGLPGKAADVLPDGVFAVEVVALLRQQCKCEPIRPAFAHTARHIGRKTRSIAVQSV